MVVTLGLFAAFQPAQAQESPSTSSPEVQTDTQPADQPANQSPRMVTGRPPGMPHPGLNFQFDLEGSHGFDANLDGVSGNFDRTRLGAKLSITTPLSESFILSASFGAGASIYDFHGQTGLVPGTQDPWETIRTASIGLSAVYRVDKQWTVFGGLNAASSGEDGSDFSDTLTGGGGIAASYALSEKLTIGLGVTAQTRLEDNLFIIPFPTVDWTLPGDPQERWRFAVGGTRIGPSRAAGAALYFSPTKEITLSTGVGAFGLGGDFRLSKDGPVPNGVGRDSSFPFLVGVDWRPSHNFSLNAFAGVALFGQLEVLDSSGNKLSERDVDPTPVLGGGLSISF